MAFTYRGICCASDSKTKNGAKSSFDESAIKNKAAPNQSRKVTKQHFLEYNANIA